MRIYRSLGAFVGPFMSVRAQYAEYEDARDYSYEFFWFCYCFATFACMLGFDNLSGKTILNGYDTSWRPLNSNEKKW